MLWFAQTSDELLLQTTNFEPISATPDDTTGLAALFTILAAYSIIWLVVAVLTIVALWRIFTKAGEAGWKSIIPIYNAYILLKIVGRPGWWLLLFFVPFVNIVVSLFVAIDLAKSFGRSDVFGVVALWLFSLVGYLMLAFGSDTYKGPAAAPGSSAQPPAQTGQPFAQA